MLTRLTELPRPRRAVLRAMLQTLAIRLPCVEILPLALPVLALLAVLRERRMRGLPALLGVAVLGGIALRREGLRRVSLSRGALPLRVL